MYKTYKMNEIVIGVIYALYQNEVIMLVAEAIVFPMFKVYGLHNFKMLGIKIIFFLARGK